MTKSATPVEIVTSRREERVERTVTFNVKGVEPLPTNEDGMGYRPEKGAMFKPVKVRVMDGVKNGQMTRMIKVSGPVVELYKGSKVTVFSYWTSWNSIKSGQRISQAPKWLQQAILEHAGALGTGMGNVADR
jgi:hypothetical protein